MVNTGKVDVWLGEDDNWRVTWRPERGHKDYPGHTFSPKDRDLPHDYPRTQNPDDLMAWAVNRFRSRTPGS